jgi:hypothetical protein
MPPIFQEDYNMNVGVAQGVSARVGQLQTGPKCGTLLSGNRFVVKFKAKRRREAMFRKSRAIQVLGLTGLLVVTLALSACAPLVQVEVSQVEPTATLAEAAAPSPPQAEEEAAAPAAEEEPAPEEATEQKEAAIPAPSSEDVRVLLEEMTLVQLLSEQTGFAETVCAGNGLNSVKPMADGPIILIPNAGDLAAGESNVSIKMNPDGEITFIPRVDGQKIRVPVDVGDRVAGEEVLSLSLDEGLQLMAAGELIWTVKDTGPYGTGHGLPGHIAGCDPQYDESDYQEWEAGQ